MSGSGSHFPTLANATWGTISAYTFIFGGPVGPRTRTPPLALSFTVRTGCKTCPSGKGCRLRGDVDQFPVFVELVENMDLQERRIVPVGSLVWLQTVDSCKRRDTEDSLYFSTKTGMFHFAIKFSPHTFGRRFADGELDCASSPTPTFFGGKLPNDVVEGGAEVMDDFTSQDAQSRNCGSAKNALAEFLKGFSVLVRKDYVIPFQVPPDFGQRRYEGGNCGIEITDILVGPF